MPPVFFICIQRPNKQKRTKTKGKENKNTMAVENEGIGESNNTAIRNKPSNIALSTTHPLIVIIVRPSYGRRNPTAIPGRSPGRRHHKEY